MVEFVSGLEIENIDNSKRVIMHVDLDAFFAACEEVKKPWLLGKPVIVGSDPREGKGRGVVSTANYVARRYGIKSAMPISWAWKRCKHGVFLRVDGKLYSEVSRRVKDILKRKADRFESGGIDEGYLDVTSFGFDGAEKLGLEIKREVFSREGLTCSVGIGSNKLIAKIGSDYRKPNGLTIVKRGDEKKFLEPLNVEKIVGIGPKSKARLNGMGIWKIGDLAKKEEKELVEKFGERWGAWLKSKSLGLGSSSVGNWRERKSIGKERTFYEDVSSRERVMEKLDELVEKIWDLVLERGISFRTVVLKIRFSDFETHTCQRSVRDGFSGVENVKGVVRNLVSGYLEDGRRVRLVGVRFVNLI
jgi:DNA polymerase IV (archaeal DinB-like DNA polymerase)